MKKSDDAHPIFCFLLTGRRKSLDPGHWGGIKGLFQHETDYNNPS